MEEKTAPKQSYLAYLRSVLIQDDPAQPLSPIVPIVGSGNNLHHGSTKPIFATNQHAGSQGINSRFSNFLC
jgi:hypothetical protein